MTKKKEHDPLPHPSSGPKKRPLPLISSSIDNLPNRLTLFRMALIPIVVSCLFLETQDWESLHSWHGNLGWVACWIFVLASLTDLMDGHIARKRGIVTTFGSFLDPIADKFLIISSLVMLLALNRVSSLMVVVLILREFYITSLRLLAFREGFQIPVSGLGKGKTTAQLMGIPLLMANGHPWGIPMPFLGSLCIYAAIFLSLYSALIYSLGPIKKLRLRYLEMKVQKTPKNPHNTSQVDQNVFKRSGISLKVNDEK